MLSDLTDVFTPPGIASESLTALDPPGPFVSAWSRKLNASAQHT
jgi:hypothetical protein